jgi:hypothetical protein
MKSTKNVRTEMSPGQVADLAQTLMNSADPIEAYLGETMWEASYEVSTYKRVDHVINALLGRKGSTFEIEQVIDAVIAKIRG